MKLHLRAKALVLLIPMLAIVGAVVTASAMWLASNNLDAKLNDELNTQLRVIATLFSDFDAKASVDIVDGAVRRVQVEAIPDFRDHSLVDRASKMTGGVATLFVWDESQQDFVRRTTSIKNETGDRALGAALGKSHPAYALLSEGKMYRGEATLFGRPYMTEYDPIFGPNGKVIGIISIGVEQKYFVESRRSLMTGMVIAALIAIILLSLAAVAMFTRIFRPLGEVNKAVDLLAHGRLDFEIPHLKLNDDIGDLARALGVFQNNAIERQRLAEAQAEHDAIRRQRAERVETLIAAFEKVTNRIVGTVSAAATHLQGAAQTMSAAAEQTSRQSVAVASASEQASCNVRTVASAAEELSASVAEIGRQVHESARIADEAAHNAESTAGKVARLSEAAQKVGDIVGLISTIAGQTNLLALNATIEAARAGDAGKGFAVVASEVKGLADQTAKAAAEIAAQIEDIQHSTAESVNAIGEITGIIRKMDEITTSIASSVEQQGEATTEIAGNVHEASAGTAEVSTNIAGVAQAASASAAASTDVLEAARDLAGQSGVLRDEVEKFLGSVRAA
jgi:methyl-accepting chemotaxis protein